MLKFWIYFKVSQKGQNNATPFDNSNLFMVELEQAFSPFPSGITHFLFFFFLSPEMKTMFPKKHNFCRADRARPCHCQSGVGWDIVFSFPPSKLQLREEQKEIESNKETLFRHCFIAVRNN